MSEREKTERAAMIEAAKEFMSIRDYAEAHDALVYEPPAGWEAQMLIDHFAEFAMDQTADLREQLRVAREAMRELPNLVPTNWCDPLLTGPDAVFTDEPNCRDIEALLRGIQDRQREALAVLDASKKETAG